MEQLERNPQHLDVKKVFYEKNPRMAKWLPGIVFWTIRKIIHEKEINRVLKEYGDKQGAAFADHLVSDFKITFDIKGIENLPKKQDVIIVSNHPLGGFDGMVLLSVLNPYFPGMFEVVNDLLMNLRNMEGTFIPVNKHGSNSKMNAVKLNDAYATGRAVLTFPAGMVSRKINGEIVDLEWKKSIISKSLEYKRDFVPIYFEGRNTKLFYLICWLRKALRIKTNLEMFFLPHELFMQKNKHFKITIKELIPYNTIETTNNQLYWAQEIKKKVYQLKENKKK
ncbi:MAG TPA: glycerol acyltransferase [Flavobacterium sp.]|nr:glycerol acyltransferase [Flavobacterium sp.]